MTPQELRIGNCVQINKGEYASSYYVIPDGCSIDRVDDLDPIKLTPEVLVRMGAKKEDGESDEGGLYFNLKRGKIYWCGGDCFKYFVNDTPITDYRVNSVHLFQTLFFILTGEELQFTL